MSGSEECSSSSSDNDFFKTKSFMARKKKMPDIIANMMDTPDQSSAGLEDSSFELSFLKNSLNNKSYVVMDENSSSADEDDVPLTRRKSHKRRRGRSAAATLPKQQRRKSTRTKDSETTQALKVLDNILMSTKKDRQKKKSKQSKKFRTVDNDESLPTIILDDDDESDAMASLPVRVLWRGEVKRVEMRRYQKFTYLFDVVSEWENVPPDRISLFVHTRAITPEDSVDSLGINIASTVEADVIPLGITLKKHNLCVPASSAQSQDEDVIELKVQSKNKKDCMVIKLKPNDKMSVLMAKYAEEKGLSLNSLKFYFDGEILDSSETPSGLDLEGGECIDVHDAH